MDRRPQARHWKSRARAPTRAWDSELDTHERKSSRTHKQLLRKAAKIRLEPPALAVSPCAPNQQTYDDSIEGLRSEKHAQAARARPRPLRMHVALSSSLSR